MAERAVNVGHAPPTGIAAVVTIVVNDQSHRDLERGVAGGEAGHVHLWVETGLRLMTLMMTALFLVERHRTFRIYRSLRRMTPIGEMCAVFAQNLS